MNKIISRTIAVVLFIAALTATSYLLLKQKNTVISDDRVSGFVTDAGETFYMEDGVRVTGWKTIDGDKFYFYKSSATKSGAAHTKGAMATGWQSIGGDRYYFYKSSSTKSGASHKKGAMATGWQSVGGDRFYFYKSASSKSGSSHKKGALATGWQKIDGKKFYFYKSSSTKAGASHKKGAMATGWQTLDGNRFYFYKSSKTGSGASHTKGEMATGWQTIDGNKYYFYKTAMSYGRSGVMAKGAVNIDDKGCVFDKSGKLLKTDMHGWYKVGDDYYFCNRKTGKMVKNGKANGIKLGSDGKAVMNQYAKEKIPVMIRAREVVAEITNDSMSLAKKALKCRQYVNSFKVLIKDMPITAHRNDWACYDAHYANNILNAYGDQRKCGGECNSQAAAMAYLFVEIGFDKVQFCHDTHGWVEADGKFYDTVFYGRDGWWAGKKSPIKARYRIDI